MRALLAKLILTYLSSFLHWKSSEVAHLYCFGLKTRVFGDKFPKSASQIQNLKKYAVSSHISSPPVCTRSVFKRS